MKKDFLNFEQVKRILPSHLKIVNKIGKRNIYNAIDGSIILFANSKDFGGEKWWYSLFIYDWLQLGVKNVCLTLGEQGIVILSMDVLLDYTKYADYNDNYNKGKRYFVRIKKENGKFVLYHSGEQNVDITSMFYQAD